jgi:MRG-binding protein
VQPGNIPNTSNNPTMTVTLPGERADEHAFLDSVEGEISFFRSIMRARPVGMHRHFHIIAVRNFISKDTGHLVHIDAIWDKLKKCYDLDALDAIVCYGFSNGILQTD